MVLQCSPQARGARWGRGRGEHPDGTWSARASVCRRGGDSLLASPTLASNDTLAPGRPDGGGAEGEVLGALQLGSKRTATNSPAPSAPTGPRRRSSEDVCAAMYWSEPRAIVAGVPAGSGEPEVPFVLGCQVVKPMCIP